MHRSRSPARNPSAGGTSPMFAAIGSTSTAAMSAPCSASARVERGEVVVGHDDRVGHRARRDAGRARQPERRDTAARLRPAARRRGRGSSRRTSRSSRGRSRRGRGAPRSSPPRCPTRRAAPSRPTATRSQIASASSTSRAVGAPNDVPSAAARCTASTTAGMRVAEDRRAPRLHVVEVLAAVGVDEVRAVRARATKNGSPPTEPNARTGELTPPGMRALGPLEPGAVTSLRGSARRPRGRSR